MNAYYSYSTDLKVIKILSQLINLINSLKKTKLDKSSGIYLIFKRIRKILNHGLRTLQRHDLTFNVTHSGKLDHETICS